MGKAKQNMELIRNDKTRYVTFQKRNKGLKKKTYELKTLSDVEVCLIIYGPKINDRPTDDQAEIWPPNPDVIKHLIDTYKNQSSEDRTRKTLGLSNFFEDRNQKIEDTLVKLRKKNDEARYFTWDDRYNGLSKEQLREFESVLEGKLQDVKARVAFMKGIDQKLSAECINDNSHTQTTQNQSYFMHGGMCGTEVDNDIANLQYCFNQAQVDANSKANPMMMMTTTTMPRNNNQYYNQLGGVSSSDFMCNPLDRPIYYDPMMLENEIVNNPLPLVAYCNLSIQTTSPSSSVHASLLDKYYKPRNFK
ncbi:Agamous-like MADS-box protein AGL82 [Camellia lanceoleosa]|uniref:Agamous-like MADS-box protein AGL82 n=1 Tax=Camellia lanceoleosa TaxID=1840588 RepID=A0ACC0H3Y3_9ERIC|nr:Agamous-like MADS-box protein AGL82 [Camellia lanceoleosa]